MLTSHAITEEMVPISRWAWWQELHLGPWCGVPSCGGDSENSSLSLSLLMLMLLSLLHWHLYRCLSLQRYLSVLDWRLICAPLESFPASTEFIIAWFYRLPFNVGDKALFISRFQTDDSRKRRALKSGMRVETTTIVCLRLRDRLDWSNESFVSSFWIFSAS